MPPTLIDAVSDELEAEYKERQTVTSRRHDEIARWLETRDDIIEWQLFLNSQVRRGFVDDEQRHDMQRRIDRSMRKALAGLEKARGG